MNKVFKKHPNLSKYYETSDGTPFFRDHDAKNHAKSLKDKTVKTVERGAEPVKEKTVKAVKTSEKVEAPKTEKAAKTSDKKEVEKGKLTPMQEAKLRVDAINEMATIAEVEKALEGETAKSVRKAGEERIAAIKATDALDNDKK